MPPLSPRSTLRELEVARHSPTCALMASLLKQKKAWEAERARRLPSPRSTTTASPRSTEPSPRTAALPPATPHAAAGPPNPLAHRPATPKCTGPEPAGPRPLPRGAPPDAAPAKAPGALKTSGDRGPTSGPIPRVPQLRLDLGKLPPPLGAALPDRSGRRSPKSPGSDRDSICTERLLGYVAGRTRLHLPGAMTQGWLYRLHEPRGLWPFRTSVTKLWCVADQHTLFCYQRPTAEGLEDAKQFRHAVSLVRQVTPKRDFRANDPRAYYFGIEWQPSKVWRSGVWPVDGPPGARGQWLLQRNGTGVRVVQLTALRTPMCLQSLPNTSHTCEERPPSQA